MTTELRPPQAKLLQVLGRSGLPAERAAGDWVCTLTDEESNAALFELTRGQAPDVVEPLSAESPKVLRKGLGWRAEYSRTGIELTLERIRESRGELSGELMVRLRQDATGIGQSGHLFGGRFNASSITARSTLAKHLKTRIGADWAGILENFCMIVLNQHREGEPVERIGDAPRRPRATTTDPLPAGKVTELIGAGGTGKSMFAAAVAVAKSTGTEVIPGWRFTPGRVLVLDWEADSQDWNDRIIAIAEGAGVKAPTIVYRRMSRPLGDDVEQIAGIVSDEAIDLIIDDSVGLAIGAASEGQSWHDGAFALFQAHRQLGPTTLAVDHIAGADMGVNTPSAKPFGSVYKWNLARSVFELRREREGTAGRTELLLLHRKVNEGSLRPAQGLAIVHEDDRIRFEHATVDAPDLVEVLSLADRMARTLRAGSQTTAFLAKELTAKESTVRAVLSRDRGQRFARLPDGRIGLAAHE